MLKKYTKDGVLDFNTIVPLPESLAKTDGYGKSRHIQNIVMYLINSYPELVKSPNETGTILRFIKELCNNSSIIDIEMVMQIQRRIEEYKDRKINYTDEDVDL